MDTDCTAMSNDRVSESENQRSETNNCKDYCFCSTWDGDGEIHNREGQIIWRFQTTALEQISGQFPVFSFRDSEGKELMAIFRKRTLPLARFSVVEKGSSVCMIHQRSIFFTKYEFELEGGPKWKLCMPMFSVWGDGASENGQKILVRAHNRRQWFVRISAGFDSPRLMAALAYITRKKLQCT